MASVRCSTLCKWSMVFWSGHGVLPRYVAQATRGQAWMGGGRCGSKKPASGFDTLLATPGRWVAESVLTNHRCRLRRPHASDKRPRNRPTPLVGISRCRTESIRQRLRTGHTKDGRSSVGCRLRGRASKGRPTFAHPHSRLTVWPNPPNLTVTPCMHTKDEA